MIRFPDLMKVTFFILFFLGATASVHAQAQPTEEVKSAPGTASIKLEGMLGISVNTNTVAVNIGGPALKVILSEHTAIGVGAFPSLFMSPDRIEPKLGLSPRIEYKRAVLIAPFYHFTSPNIWVGTVGMCYRLHK